MQLFGSLARSSPNSSPLVRTPLLDNSLFSLNSIFVYQNKTFHETIKQYKRACLLQPLNLHCIANIVFKHLRLNLLVTLRDPVSPSAQSNHFIYGTNFPIDLFLLVYTRVPYLFTVCRS